MMQRRDFLRMALGVAPLVFVPQIGGWFRKGSGLLVRPAVQSSDSFTKVWRTVQADMAEGIRFEAPEFTLGERMIIDRYGVFRAGDRVALTHQGGGDRMGVITAVDNRLRSITVDWVHANATPYPQWFPLVSQ